LCNKVARGAAAGGRGRGGGRGSRGGRGGVVRGRGGGRGVVRGRGAVTRTSVERRVLSREERAARRRGDDAANTVTNADRIIDEYIENNIPVPAAVRALVNTPQVDSSRNSQLAKLSRETDARLRDAIMEDIRRRSEEDRRGMERIGGGMERIAGEDSGDRRRSGEDSGDESNERRNRVLNESIDLVKYDPETCQICLGSLHGEGAPLGGYVRLACSKFEAHHAFHAHCMSNDY
jgi:hypothetical protein